MTNKQSTAQVTKGLKDSPFLKAKFPGKKLAAFLKNLKTLPENQRKKAMKIIVKADKEAAKWIKKQSKEAKSFIKSTEELVKKTKTSIQRKSKTQELNIL
jgi:hypothetical protein